MPDTYSGWLAIIADRLLIVAVIVVVCIAITRLTLGALRRVLGAMQARAQSESSLDEAAEVAKRFTTIDALVGYVVKGFVLTIGGLLVLEQIGLDVGPAIAGLGVVGIAIGFGAQAIVRDFFSGILILLENQYGQGDVVEIAGVTGTVEELTLRRTVLRDADGVVHNVPNGEIKVASNRTRVWRRINHDVVVAYGTDIEHAIQVFDAVGAELAADPAWGPRILETPAVDRVDQLGERGNHPQDPGPGPGRRDGRRDRRAAQADPGRDGRQRDRDPGPGPALGHAGQRLARRRPVGQARPRRRSTWQRRPVRRGCPRLIRLAGVSSRAARVEWSDKPQQ